MEQHMNALERMLMAASRMAPPDEIQRTAVRAVLAERRFQDAKHGHPANNPHTVGAWLLVLEAELNEAKLACIKGGVGRDNVIAEIVQVAATAIACLEQWGVDEIPGRTV